EHGLRLVRIVEMKRHVETVLRLVDARRPFLAHVGSHDRLVADFEPAMHEPVLLFGRDGHVRRTFAVRHCRLDLAAQHSGIKLERLPALSLKRQARHDLHGIVSWPEGSILDVLTFETPSLPDGSSLSSTKADANVPDTHFGLDGKRALPDGRRGAADQHSPTGLYVPSAVEGRVSDPGSEVDSSRYGSVEMEIDVSRA